MQQGQLAAHQADLDQRSNQFDSQLKQRQTELDRFYDDREAQRQHDALYGRQSAQPSGKKTPTQQRQNASERQNASDPTDSTGKQSKSTNAGSPKVTAALDGLSKTRASKRRILGA